MVVVADPKTKGMVALVPTAADAQRLAVDGGLPVDEIHLTLLFLGDAADWDDTSRAALLDAMQPLAGTGPVDGDGFALSVFNTGSDEKDTCIVLGVGGQAVDDIHSAVVEAAPPDNLPEQHLPWVAHVSLVYTDDLTKLAGLVDRTGPITFDRLRVAFADDITDLPLTSPVALAQAVTVPAAPPLARINRVELMHAGTWSASTGVHTFTLGDFHAAVAALDCPAVRRPVLKLGHTDPRFDGEPAVGWIDNLAVDENGLTVVGDYVGMPGWLGQVIASAYPDRSIEGQWHFVCQIGHTHPFVLTAVALLGVQPPAIGTLQSLQDVAALYGVAASSEPPSTGVPVAVTVRASEEPEMPNPRPVTVAASVSVEDVRREYYDKAPWSYWITEVHLDPLELIVNDDDSGKRFRVPVDVTGEDSFTFGEPVEVLIRYIDKPTDTATVSAAAGPIVFASRGESRPGSAPVALAADEPEQASAEEPSVNTPGGTPELPAAEPEPTPDPKEDLVSADLSAVRSRLGLPDDTDEAAVTAAVLAALDQQSPAEPDTALDDLVDTDEPEKALVAAAPVAASSPKLPAGVVTIDETTLADLRRNAMLGAAAHERQRTADRDTAITDAVQLGKIPPARVEHWTKAWEADPDGTKATLSALEAGLVPVALTGTAGPGEGVVDSDQISADEAAAWGRLLNIPAEELTRD